MAYRFDTDVVGRDQERRARPAAPLDGDKELRERLFDAADQLQELGQAA